MSLASRLQANAMVLLDQARSLGVPVHHAETLYAETLRPALLKKLAIYAIPFVKRSGVKILELESGRVVCRMPLRGNVNHIGCMYAGALFTLAEFSGGPLMLATYGISRFIPIVTSLDMEFVRVAKTDVTVELSLAAPDIDRIEAETLNTGKAEFTLDGQLIDANGELVARSHAVYQMRPKRR